LVEIARPNMKDYHVKIKVRNNRLLQAIYDAGGEPGFKWCHANGLRYNNVNWLLNMTESPINKKTNDYSETAIRLCEVLNKSPNELWSEDQLTALETNAAEFDMSKEEITSLMNNQEESYLPDLDKFELTDAVEDALSQLTEREQIVMRLRFMDGMTLKEIGDHCGVQLERIRQIEAKALRKLRHPTGPGAKLRLFGEYSEKHYEDDQKRQKQIDMMMSEVSVVEPLIEKPKPFYKTDEWWELVNKLRGESHDYH